jgi:hypothetical protein
MVEPEAHQNREPHPVRQFSEELACDFQFLGRDQLVQQIAMAPLSDWLITINIWKRKGRSGKMVAFLREMASSLAPRCPPHIVFKWTPKVDPG